MIVEQVRLSLKIPTSVVQMLTTLEAKKQDYSQV